MSEKVVCLSNTTRDGISYSDVISLKDSFSGFSYCALRRVDRLSRLYYCVMILNVGHADFYGNDSQDSKVIMCRGAAIHKFESPYLPQLIRESINQMSNDFNAVEIQEQWRGQGLGALLWAISCLVIFQETAQPIAISDSTDRREPKTSFYERWGAEKSSGVKVASKLSADQITLLLSAGIHVESS